MGAEGDGNCLFRTVSHQIYGTQEHHGLIRRACVDYMENEAAYFSNFVALSVGGFLTFADYLNNMRSDGEWGDEPEIQAMCEMYDRPADVYVYDEEIGCRVVRRMHNVGESASVDPATRQPLRLSFYGGGHYDSLVEVAAGNEENYYSGGGGGKSGEHRRVGSVVCSTAAGVMESAALDTARARLGRGEGENVTAGNVALEAALRASRLAWDEHGGTSMEEAQMEWAMRGSRSGGNTQEEEDLQRGLVQSEMEAHRRYGFLFFLFFLYCFRT